MESEEVSTQQVKRAGFGSALSFTPAAWVPYAVLGVGLLLLMVSFLGKGVNGVLLLLALLFLAAGIFLLRG